MLRSYSGASPYIRKLAEPAQPFPLSLATEFALALAGKFPDKDFGGGAGK
jgi:hypothetical protein